MTTWRELFSEIDVDVEKLTIFPRDIDIDKEFDDGYGGTEGREFTAWDKDWVYFPVCYDGSEWVGKAPRNPCSIATCHIGGG